MEPTGRRVEPEELRVVSDAFSQYLQSYTNLSLSLFGRWPAFVPPEDQSAERIDDLSTFDAGPPLPPGLLQTQDGVYRALHGFNTSPPVGRRVSTCNVGVSRRDSPDSDSPPPSCCGSTLSRRAGMAAGQPRRGSILGTVRRGSAVGGSSFGGSHFGEDAESVVEEVVTEATRLHYYTTHYYFTT